MVFGSAPSLLATVPDVTSIIRCKRTALVSAFNVSNFTALCVCAIPLRHGSQAGVLPHSTHLPNTHPQFVQWWCSFTLPL